MTTSTKEIRDLVARFLDEVCFDSAGVTETSNKNLEERSTEIWNAYVLDATANRHGLKYLPLCCRISHMTYPEHPLEVRAYCAVYTVFHVLMDLQDQVSIHRITLHDLERFVLLSTDTKGMTHPILGPFARFLTAETARSFSPIQTIGLFKSSMDYVLGSLCERKFPHGFPTSTTEFPGWLRYKTGLGEPYAYFFLSCVEKERQDTYLPIVPLIAEYIQYTNDILSVYKEHRGAERNNYVSLASQATSSDSIDVLSQLISRVAEIKKRLERFCADVSLADYCTKMIHGYIAWHIMEDRYRLGEIGFTILAAPAPPPALTSHAETRRQEPTRTTPV